MSRIWFVGDPHGQFGFALKALEQSDVRPQAMVFLGDLEPFRPLREIYAPFEAAGVACWHIHGNHDTDRPEAWHNLLDGADRNLDGRVATIAGFRIAGLGGVFRGEVWYPQYGDEEANYQNYEEAAKQAKRMNLRNRLSAQKHAQLQAAPGPDTALLDESKQGKILKHRSTIFPETAARLASLRADILVTHEAPSGHLYGFAGIDQLARRLGVRMLVHGHHHFERPYDVDPDRPYVPVPIGYRGIKDEDGNVIRAFQP